jgi:HEAT repeat protein
MFPGAARAESARGNEQEQLAILSSGAGPGEKALACKRLAVVGTAAAVPPLAELLNHPELGSWARIGLEAIDGPEASAALRAALATVRGRDRAGVVQSLGVRRDPQAVRPLGELLAGADDDAASAAAVALGRIGGEAARDALLRALGDRRPAVRGAAAEGTVLWADAMLEQGQTAAAGEAFAAVLAAEAPPQRLLEARRGVILTSGDRGGELTARELRAADKRRFALGLTVLRELPPEAPLDAVIAAWGDLPADRQALLLRALGDRGGERVRPLVADAARSGPPAVRLAAIDALLQLGTADLLPVLLELNASKDPALREAATAALKEFGGAATDAAIVARLDAARGEERRALLGLIGLRQIDAVEKLRAALDDPDPATRAAALASLGAVVRFEQLPLLVERAVAVEGAPESDAALKALQAAALRMPDREACAQRLADALQGASVQVQSRLIGILTELGGAAALASVARAAESDAQEVADAATGALGRWMTPDASGPLWELAQGTSTSPYRVRALRGYLRIARQFALPDAERMAMCQRGWEAAERLDEKRLVLQILKRYPTERGLELAVAAAREPALREEARQTATAIAEKLEVTPAVRAQLDRLELLFLQEGEGPAAFRKLRLHDKFVSEGAVAADFNRDGALDVVAGPYWYAGPEFRDRRTVREPKEFDPLSYSDNFLTFADDFNADGWTDILYIPWPGEDASWYENPGDSAEPWKARLALKNVGNESPNWIDVDGDGRRDLVFNVDGRLGYGSWDPARPGELWTFQVVSTPGSYQRYTHGAGCGDLNGDGRRDILESVCWWEQPERIVPGEPWRRHDYPFAEAGAQMLVTDVDGDGLQDVVTAWHCHRYGLVWHRQIRGADGGIAFERHAVMAPEPDLAARELRISQMHAMTLADMNGDGIDDVVTGKRFWAHGPNGDVEPAAPAALLWFAIERGPGGRVRFAPHLIDDDSGVGTQVATADLNGDATPDAIVSNKKGTFVFLSR